MVLAVQGKGMSTVVQISARIDRTLKQQAMAELTLSGVTLKAYIEHCLQNLVDEGMLFKTEKMDSTREDT